MRQHRLLMWPLILGAAVCLAASYHAAAQEAPAFDETAAHREARMAWWREARFGMFIHWGLYAIPAGRWEGRPVGGVGEWLMQFARIPPSRYETLVAQFNPVKFDADAWARLAKDAGMRYLVITSKHHDGFALFDSAASDYDVMATPFQRDIMKELAEACRRQGIRIGWYHSILDWHHPDYLPKPDWSDQPPEAADFSRYKEYLFAQVREVLTNYGPIDIMWFDGEWDRTWTREDGLALDALVRQLQPDIIVNNRVGKQRYADAADLPPGARFAGDFGTPEQEIPATGLPGEDWETCMTMNDTWGFKTDDDNWKSPRDLIHNLIDIASKGGNFLLNVGPTAEGVIPEPSVERLKAMGEWLKVNGEAIYGTQASPFEHLEWGRCTMRRLANGDTRLYLHVFEWPGGPTMSVPGITNQPIRAALLTADGREAMSVWRSNGAIAFVKPTRPVHPAATVIALDVQGEPDVCPPPIIEAPSRRFVDSITVVVHGRCDDAAVMYQLGTAMPDAWMPIDGPIIIDRTRTLHVRHERDGRPISATRSMVFEQVSPRRAVEVADVEPGVRYEYFEADCNAVADLLRHEPAASGVSPTLDISLRRREEHYGFRFRGLIRVPRDAMYRFILSSDDGATLTIGDELVVDHDGLHAASEKHGEIALAAGLHPFEILFFEKGGDEALDLWIEAIASAPATAPAPGLPGMERRRVDASMLLHAPSD